MFNLSGFNQSRFNLAETLDAVRLKTVASETIDGRFGLAQNVQLTTNAAEQVNGTMQMLQGTLLQMAAIDAAEAIAAKAALVATSSQTAAVVESVVGELHIGANVTPQHDSAETIAARLRLGANVYRRAVPDEAVSAAVVLGANVASAEDAFEMFSAISEAENAEVRTLLLDVILKPGDSLILDSENYTVFHNGESVLHKHSGAWVQLSRNTRNIQIDTGSAGALSAAVLFTERYL